MNNKKNLLSSLLYVAVYAVVYFYLKNSGLWGRYRWTGLVFGAVVSAVALLLRNNRFGAGVSSVIAPRFRRTGTVRALQDTELGDGQPYWPVTLLDWR